MFGWTDSVNTYAVITSGLIYPRNTPSPVVFTSIAPHSSPTLPPLDLVGSAPISSTAGRAPPPGERCGWCPPPSFPPSLSLSLSLSHSRSQRTPCTHSPPRSLTHCQQCRDNDVRVVIHLAVTTQSKGGGGAGTRATRDVSLPKSPFLTLASLACT
jgi:hypothetical protein